MRSFDAQLNAYSQFLDPPELAQIQELLETGRFGAQQTNGLITDAGRGDIGTGRRYVPGASNRSGILETRQNLLNFIQNNSASPKPGVPTTTGVARAITSTPALAQGFSQRDLDVLTDVANGTPAPQAPAARPAASVSQAIPNAKPIMSATQPAPAAPTPRPSLTSTPSGPAKVSATPTARGKVAAGFRYQQPVAAAPAAALTGMPGTARATEELAGSPGIVKYLQEIFTGGKQAAGQGLQGAGNGLKGANSAVGRGLAKNGLKLAGAGGILSVLSAAGEFADEDDPFARNASEAAGNFAGGWGGAAGGAALGTMVLPGIGTAVGAIGGGILGTEVGSNIAGGIYDAVTGQSEEDRLRDQMVKDANLKQQLVLQQAATQRQIMVDNREAMMPFVKDGLAIKREDDFSRGERDLRIQNDYNYANSLNQAMLQAQNNNNIQELALTQYMMG